jgi:ubiquinone/menaquinone biosynthesis C-methylase UbiE
VGLDISKQRIYLMNRRLREAGFDVALLIGDAQNTPFRSGAFDIAFSTDVIEHLPDPSRGIQEIVRVSKNKVVICTPNKLCPLDMSRFAEIFGTHTRPAIEEYVTRFQLMKMLQNSKLKQGNIILIETSFLPLGLDFDN